MRLSAFRNEGQSTIDGILGIVFAPVHMVTAGVGQFKDRLWHTFHTIALACFLRACLATVLCEEAGVVFLSSKEILCLASSETKSRRTKESVQ